MTVRTVNSARPFRHKEPFEKDQGQSDWIRNPSWLTMPTIVDGDQQLNKLIAVDYDSSIVEFTLRSEVFPATYTIDWGDGNTDTYTTTTGNQQVRFVHTYDWNNANLDNTNAPATITSSVITRNGHGYPDGYRLFLNDISGPTNINDYTEYYVVNSTTNTFQISETQGGSAITIDANGSLNLLPYKQAIIQASCDRNINYWVMYSTQYTTLWPGIDQNYAYDQNYLQIDVNLPYVSSIATFRGSTQDQRYFQYPRMEIVNFYNVGYLASLNYLFASCKALKAVPNFNIPDSVYQCDGLFLGCVSLEYVPDNLNTSQIWNMNRMFYRNYSLKRLPEMDTSNCRNAYQFAYEAFSIKHVPTYDFSNVTDYAYMFYACYSLEKCDANLGSPIQAYQTFAYCRNLRTLPKGVNFDKIVNAGGFFLECRSIEDRHVKIYAPEMIYGNDLFQRTPVESVDLYAPKLEYAHNMFYYCYNLRKMKLETHSLIRSSGMFQRCRSLKDLSQFNIVGDNLLITSGMFNECYSLTEIPYFDVSNVREGNGMFYGCSSLSAVPEFNFTTKLYYGNDMFSQCFSLTKAPVSLGTALANCLYVSGIFYNCYCLQELPFATMDVSSAVNINNMFYNCYQLKYAPKLIIGPNCTAASNLFRACESLEYMPTIDNFGSVERINYMFYYLRSLKEVPPLDFSGVNYTQDTNCFHQMYGLKKFRATNLGAGGLDRDIYLRYGQLSASELDNFFTNLADISAGTSRSISIQNQTGKSGANTTIATNKGWTVIV